MEWHYFGWIQLIVFSLTISLKVWGEKNDSNCLLWRDLISEGKLLLWWLYNSRVSTPESRFSQSSSSQNEMGTKCFFPASYDPRVFWKRQVEAFQLVRGLPNLSRACVEVSFFLSSHLNPLLFSSSPRFQPRPPSPPPPVSPLSVCLSLSLLPAHSVLY